MTRLDQVRDRLRSVYRRGLPSKIDALQAAIVEFDAGVPNAELMLRRMSHQLRGSGASYGFEDITDSAGVAETADREDLVAAIEALIDTLAVHVVARSEALEPTGILLIDDDPDYTAMVAEILDAPDRKLRIAHTVDVACTTIESQPIDLVLLDLLLDEGDGREVLIRLRGRRRTETVPVIVLSANLTKFVELECYALGADLVLDKTVDRHTLSAIVSGALERHWKTHRLARVDSLTSLPNRIAFEEAFDRAQASGQRSRAPLSVAMIDLDRFKEVNDQWGHETGDRVLRHVARQLSKNLRQVDTVARWGGEEFAVLLPDAVGENAATALRDAAKKLENEPVLIDGETSISVLMSAGVTQVNPADTVDDAIERADALLMEAKQAGGRQVLKEVAATERARPAILVADDDPDMQLRLRLLLELEDLQVMVTSSGEEALEALQQHGFRLVLVDAVMPGMSGFDLLQKLRKVRGHAATPVMMLTALGDEAGVERAFSLGADEYLTKPFREREFLARVRRLLRNRR